MQAATSSQKKTKQKTGQSLEAELNRFISQNQHLIPTGPPVAAATIAPANPRNTTYGAGPLLGFGDDDDTPPYLRPFAKQAGPRRRKKKS